LQGLLDDPSVAHMAIRALAILGHTESRKALKKLG
jgi:hypothetical protein